MKIQFDKQNEVEERTISQEKHLRKIIVNSIEPKTGHSLYEFHRKDGHFEVFQTWWKTNEWLCYVWNGKEFVKKPKENSTKIDLFDPYFKANGLKSTPLPPQSSISG